MHDQPTPLAYTIPDAVRASGIARTRIYALIAEGALESRKAGRRTLITANSLNRYLDGLPPACIRLKKAA
ncbi:MAG: helix-turn-helix domain-containing protein [Janthinobacterium lividum]